VQQIRFEWAEEIEQAGHAQPVEVELRQETITVLIALMARALISVVRVAEEAADER
jgi:hypothetical protein